MSALNNKPHARLGTYYDRAGKRIGLIPWALKFEDIEQRTVAVDFDGQTMVSTIWEGIDGGPRSMWSPPMIFETAVIFDGKSVYKKRYATEEEALEGHNAACIVAYGRPARPEDGHAQTIIDREKNR